jgi:hypothetical protein
MAITINKQINLDSKAILRAMQKAAYDEAVKQGEKVGSFDAFCIRTAHQVHFLASDGQTEVALASVAVMVPNLEE